jgi:hypothetical protein
VALALALGLAPAPAPAADEIGLQVMVSRISEAAGEIDARASALHEKLSKEFRYRSLEVLQVRDLRLAPGEVATLDLPGGKRLLLRPLQRDGDSVLLAVQAGEIQTDVRVRNGHLVVIGAERDRDGKVVISVEPRW